MIVCFMQQAPRDVIWSAVLDEVEELLASKRESARGRWVAVPCVLLCRLHWCQIPLRCLPGQGSGSQGFGASRRVFIPKTVKVNAQGLLIRSPDSLRRLTLCNYDCKILTAAMCSGLRGFSVECIHPSQRCVTQRIMTDNIFEIETAAITMRTCYSEDPTILLTDSPTPTPALTTDGSSWC